MNELPKVCITCDQNMEEKHFLLEFLQLDRSGKCPYLRWMGKKVHQSLAICRYLAKQLNLAGDSDWEAFQIDMVVDTMSWT